MTRAGETGGVLEESLIRVADQLENEDSLRRQIKSAMVYPGVVLTFALIVLVGLVDVPRPGLRRRLQAVRRRPPGHHEVHRRALEQLQELVVRYGSAGPSAPFSAFRKWKSTYRGRGQWDAFRLRIPMKIGDIVQKIALARWSRTLSALVSAGVPLLAALDITAQTAGNRVVENAMADVIESVKRGGTIADPLKSSAVFPGMVSHMVGVGEETGALDTMLSKIADFYEDQVDVGGQVADVDPRADHARRRRRHRRVHRHLDVHAAVQGVRLDQVAAAREDRAVPGSRIGRPPLSGGLRR